MNDVRNFLIKLIVSMIIFAISLDAFFDAGFSDILTFSVLTTVLTYFIGDKIILPRLSSRQAALIDFFTVYMLVWIFGNVLLHSYEQIAYGSITAAFLTGVSELILHQLLKTEEPNRNRVISQSRTLSPKLAFGTEMAEETNPLPKNQKED